MFLAIIQRIRIHAFVGLLACGVFSPAPAALFAQSRSRVTFRGITTPGEFTSSSSTFRGYSYGLGSLRGPSPGPGGGVLRSSIAGASQYSIHRGGGSAAGGPGFTAALAPVSAGRRIDNRIGQKIAPQGGAGIGKALLESKGLPMVASGYLKAVSPATGGLLEKRNEPITSLVPDRPSPYRTCMERGETAFRAGDFAKAFEEFHMANSAGRHDPESLLSLLHTRLALDRYSYARAAFYLRETLKYLPELPLVPLRPRGFYDNKVKYVDHRMRLEAFARKYSTDADANMVLAYFRWFDDRPQAAQRALAKALAGAKNPDQIDAIEIFWDGMLASGKVSGKLLPETLPAARPASRNE